MVVVLLFKIKIIGFQINLKRQLNPDKYESMYKNYDVEGLPKAYSTPKEGYTTVDGGGYESSCGLLALICRPFLKGTQLEEQLSLNDPSNKRTDALLNENGFSKDVCRSMVAMLDTDKSGKLGFEEFEALLSDIAKWNVVFKVYDQGQTGRIDGFQLREALSSAGYHLNNRVLNALAHRYGSRDGKIAFDDFLMCTVKIKTYIDMFKEYDANKTNTATFTLDQWIENTIYS